MGIKINIGDVWKDVSSVKINIGDVWKDVSNGWINIGDAWKNFYSNFKNGLISIWEFNESSGTIAYDSYSDNDLYSSSSLSFITSPVTNLSNGIEFTDNYLTGGTSLPDPTSNNHTITAWIYPYSDDRVSTTSIFSISPKDYTIYAHLNYTSTTQFKIYVGLEDGEGASGYIISDNYNSNNVYFICVTYDGTYLKLYVNNSYVNQSIYSYTSSTSSKSIYLGGGGYALYSFYGVIDQPTLWNKILSSNDMTTLYNYGGGLAYSNW